MPMTSVRGPIRAFIERHAAELGDDLDDHGAGPIAVRTTSMHTFAVARAP
jgi:hypothetical protein